MGKRPKEEWKKGGGRNLQWGRLSKMRLSKSRESQLKSHEKGGQDFIKSLFCK